MSTVRPVLKRFPEGGLGRNLNGDWIRLVQRNRVNGIGRTGVVPSAGRFNSRPSRRDRAGLTGPGMPIGLGASGPTGFGRSDFDLTVSEIQELGTQTGGDWI